jgi:hypothetical protein
MEDVKRAAENSIRETSISITQSPVKVAEMLAFLTVEFYADPVTAQKLANKISRQLAKDGVSADVTLGFETVGQHSAAGAGSTAA